MPDGILHTYFLGDLCSNDPHFYQACDKKLGGKITNSDILCEYYICEVEFYSPHLFTTVEISIMDFEGRCEANCVNTDLNKELCDNRTVSLQTGELVHPSEICNEICDLDSCEDEATCNGYTYGIFCNSRRNPKRLVYAPPNQICDGYHKECADAEDEASCEITEFTKTSCRHWYTGKQVPVHNYTRCTSVDKSNAVISSTMYCTFDDLILYQTNCSDESRIGVTCEINGYWSSVSKYLICIESGIAACDDYIDKNCFSTRSCKVHKHLLCDDRKDCDDNADETHQICSSMTTATCKRRVGAGGEIQIPISWIRDGVRDCEDGTDETGNWPTCGQGKSMRIVSSQQTKCENVFICQIGNKGFVELSNLCDGLETCGNENEICSVSSRSQSVTKSVRTTEKGLTKHLSYCLKGLESIPLLIADICINQHFIVPEGNIFGVDTKTLLIFPHGKQYCDHMYGELYVYTSCTDRCSSACPIRNIPRYEVCPNQFPNRVGTIVDNKYLIFFTKTFGNVYTNRYFVCDDKSQCLDYTQVCDLVYDCLDKSDETGCTNHFKCNSSGKLLPKTKQCDGYIDCADISDECNEQCSKTILEGGSLKGFSWLIGILAVLANLIVIGHGLVALKRCKTTVAVINRILIMIIALGDFFIGCYILVIAVYDTIMFKKDYCHKQISWIISFGCSAIGVFSTFGSQISLFAMTGLSVVRMHGIWNSMRIPGEVTKLKMLKVVAAMLSLIFVSAAIAIVPVIGILEDFFVNGVKFLDQLKIFIGTPDKATVQAVTEAYYGRAKDEMLNWKMLIQMVQDMFSHDLDYDDFTKEVSKVDFYGNDGVCLFKYFVNNKDPQRNSVWSILSLNFLCFIFISLSYILIGILSRKSSRNIASPQNNKQITKRNNRMNRRIAIIITTDFLCWLPFIIVCVLHSLEVIDATPWYSIFSMIILPINSVINPFLYDGAITNVIKKSLRSLSANLFQRIQDWTNPAQTETTELDRF